MRRSHLTAILFFVMLLILFAECLVDCISVTRFGSLMVKRQEEDVMWLLLLPPEPLPFLLEEGRSGGGCPIVEYEQAGACCGRALAGASPSLHLSRCITSGAG